jgi:hypothetical protein
MRGVPPNAALLAIIAFADEHPIAVLAISFVAAPFNGIPAFSTGC